MVNRESFISETLREGRNDFKSFFQERALSVHFKPYTGSDPTATTAIFSGQGQQIDPYFAGLLKSYPRLRDCFQQADAFARAKNWSRPSLILTAPQRLNPDHRAQIKNLALLALEVGLFEELTRLGFSFKSVAGYSFGEYAAWTAAGVLSFAQMLEVVYWREALSPAPHAAGVSILVRASAEKLEKLLSGLEYYVANVNLPEQLILTTTPESAGLVLKTLRAKKVAAQKLNELTQPYHSPLMRATAESLSQKLSEIELEVSYPRFPVYSSTAGQWIEASCFNRRQFVTLLSKQLVEPVSFPQLSLAVAESGGRSLMELGPGHASLDLIARLEPKTPMHFLSLKDYFQSEDARPKEFGERVRKSKYVGLVSKVVSRLTGYELEDILIEDRFQEDLGVDSLKKAEVLFEVLNEAEMTLDENMNSSAFNSLGDLIEYMEVGGTRNASENSVTKKQRPFERHIPAWLRLPNSRLEKARHETEAVHLKLDRLLEFGSRDEIIGEIKNNSNSTLTLILDCGEDPSSPSISQWTSFIRLWRDSFAELSARQVRLACVGPVHSERYAGARAFFMSLAAEWPQMKVLPVAYSKNFPTTDWVCKQMQMADWAERLVTPENVFLREWQVQSGATPAPPLLLRKMVWLGGAGGVSFELLSRFTQRSNCELHILGRRPEFDLMVQSNLGMLEVDYANVIYHQVDASDRKAVATKLSEIQASGAIDLLVNSTGVDRSAKIHEKLDADIADELTQKLASAKSVIDWCKENPEVQQIHFSSIAGLFGNASQTVYALANATLSTQVLNSDSEALIIHWPAWQNTGMTARPAVRLTLKESGVPLLGAQEAADFFWHEIALKSKGEVSYFPHPFSYRARLRQMNLEPLTSYMGQLSKSQILFEKLFSLGEDSYLSDHRIQDKPCVPAASVLTMFLTMGYLAEGRFLAIQDFSMLNLIPIDDTGVQCNLLLTSSETGPQVQLQSLFPHARARLTDAETEYPPPKIPLASRGDGEAINISDYYQTHVLFHGPKLQMLNEVWQVDSSTLRARIARGSLPQLHSCEFFDSLMPVFDGCFQALVISSYLKTNLKSLPVGFKHLKFKPECAWTENFWLQAELQSVEPGRVLGAIYVYNDRSEVIAELHGVDVREGIAAFTKNWPL